MKQHLIFFVLFFSLFASPAFSQGIWDTASTVGYIPNIDMPSVVVNDKIYIIGYPTQAFDPISNSWQAMDTTGQRFETATAAAANGKIYVIPADMWQPINEMGVFDPAKNAWSTIQTNGALNMQYDIQAVAIGTKIYVTGSDTNEHIQPVEVFDITTNSWSIPTQAGKPAAGVSCFVDNKIYVISSLDSSREINSFVISVFDPSTNTWTQLATTGSNTPRIDFAAAAANGKIYVVGGDSIFSAPERGTTGILDIFDPATNSWSTPVTKGSMTPRFSATAAAVGDRIYVIGGGITVGDPLFFLKKNEFYSPNTSAVENEQEISSITFFPNPTTGVITIHNVPPNMQHITFSNVLGETVSEVVYPRAGGFTIDLSKLPPGTYVARFALPDEIITRKIIKE
jgi:hypothetical protein